ncbi:uncharacterized protein LOC142786698 isoform X1 [Rhipicephalus microplus]|uniref:uncharacterized protein LOC142786698 isoform X1 n=1 Tax=Rhipicephalus microplus TaxID=6941 RepID=UPI003F6C3EE9
MSAAANSLTWRVLAITMALSLKSIFAALVLFVALPQIKAWETGQWYCHRLVPLSITSVATPCTFPCLLISPHYGHHSIVVRQEADGTPCKVTTSPLEVQQGSRCRNGICPLPDLRLYLKRMKRGAIHSYVLNDWPERVKAIGGNNQGNVRKKPKDNRRKKKKNEKQKKKDDWFLKRGNRTRKH